MKNFSLGPRLDFCGDVKINLEGKPGSKRPSNLTRGIQCSL